MDCAATRFADGGRGFLDGFPRLLRRPGVACLTAPPRTPTPALYRWRRRRSVFAASTTVCYKRGSGSSGSPATPTRPSKCLQAPPTPCRRVGRHLDRHPTPFVVALHLRFMHPSPIRVSSSGGVLPRSFLCDRSILCCPCAIAEVDDFVSVYEHMPAPDPPMSDLEIGDILPAVRHRARLTCARAEAIWATRCVVCVFPPGTAPRGIPA